MAKAPRKTLSTPRGSGKQTKGRPINPGATAYRGIPGGSVSKTNGVSTTRSGPKANWQSPAGAGGRNVIPRRTVNGAGRTNMFLSGGLDG